MITYVAYKIGEFMLDKIIMISKEAGEIIRDGFRKKLTLEYKSNITDYATNIDKASEEKIIENKRNYGFYLKKL